MNLHLSRKNIAVCFSAMLAALPLFAKADSLSNMVSPVTDPVNFEDPRINTELRPIYVYHKIGNDFVTTGGSAQIYALQARYAVNDDLAIIATKDGIVNFQPDSALNDGSGVANVAGGVKYAFYNCAEQGLIATGGLTFEAPVGEEEVLQGKGKGFLRPFLSAGAALDGVNLIGYTGMRIAMSEHDSTVWDFNVHADVPVGDFYPGLELNLQQVMDAGDRLPIPDEGADFFGLGSSQSEDRTVLVAGVVGRYRVNKSVDLGLGYQFPLTTGKGSRIFDWRITTDVIVSF